MFGLGLLRLMLVLRLAALAGMAVTAYEGWTLLSPKAPAASESQKAPAGAVGREAAKEPPPADSAAGVGHSIRASSVVKRILIWLAFAALLPVVLIPMVKHFLEQESNAVNFALLFGLTLADLAMAFLLCGLCVSEWLPAVALVGSAIAGGAYNFWLCSTIERLRK